MMNNFIKTKLRLPAKMWQAMLVLFATCLGMQMFGGQINAEAPVYKIGIEDSYAPFEVKDENGEWTGINPELMNEISRLENFEYEFVDRDFKVANEEVLAGKIDAAMPVSITPARQLDYDFSDPFFKSGIIVASYQGTDINNLNDLKGKKVGVRSGTTDAAYAEKLAKKYDFTVVEFSNTHAVYNDVVIGNVEATFDDEPIIENLIKDGVPLKIITKPASITSNSLIVKRDKHAELIKKFNHGLAQLKANGRYDEIVNKYVQVKHPKPVITAEMTDSDVASYWQVNERMLLRGLLIVVIMFGAIWALAGGLALELYLRSQKQKKLAQLLDQAPAFAVGNIAILVVGVIVALGLTALGTFSLLGWIVGGLLIIVLEGVAFAKRLQQAGPTKQHDAKRKVLWRYHLLGTGRATLVLAMAGFYVAAMTNLIKMVPGVVTFEIWGIVVLVFIAIFIMLTVWQRKCVRQIKTTN